uniref:Uncharacterized protein n=2 Tax=Hemiselmis andersenii TaxID=464988 RepID=A0A7S1EGC9_HEMAN|mmetsp:Transcript_48466/g.117696  ORF Transcript_48466/g.117696 Transcript_48466/m.117696 type:complete len:103 (+) Transcript_48466:107-415(+)
MVFKGGYVRTPTADTHGTTEPEGKPKDEDFHRWCFKFFGTLIGYVVMVSIMIMSVPHDIEWDVSHILWPVAPAIVVGAGGFFFMIYFLFWDEYKEKLDRKKQ